MGIDQYTMSSSRQSNQAKLGFFPTSLDVVRMEMDLIDFTEVENTNTELNITDLTGGEGDQLNEMHQYLTKKGLIPHSYYNEMNEDRYDICVGKYPHFIHNKGNARFLKIGVKRNKTLDKKVFGIIRNNPPYGFDKNREGLNIRLEVALYDDNSAYNTIGGIHILEVPIGSCDKSFLGQISYKYDYKMFKFPTGEYEKFKQVCLVMKAKKKIAINSKLVKYTLEQIATGTLPELGTSPPVFKITKEDLKKFEPIHYFRNNIINDESLKNGAEQVWKDIQKLNLKKTKNSNILKEKPIIELLQGHVSSLLISGRYNGIMGNFLVAGGSNKTIKTTSEMDDKGNETITETEILQPFLEITNKDGDIMYKDF